MSDLEEERDFLLASLRDLEAEHAAGDIDEADFVALRDDYTARAAAVMRRLDGTSARSGRDVGLSTPKSTARRTRVVAALLLVALLAGTAGALVARSSGERKAGESVSGSLPASSADRITQAQTLTSQGKILDAVKLYDAVLADDPQNAVALAQRGWLVSRVDTSLVDSGLDSINRAIALDPTYAEAHFFRGIILMQAKNDPNDAADEFQKALDTHPPQEMSDIFTQYRDSARSAANGTSPPTTVP